MSAGYTTYYNYLVKEDMKIIIVSAVYITYYYCLEDMEKLLDFEKC